MRLDISKYSEYISNGLKINFIIKPFIYFKHNFMNTGIVGFKKEIFFIIIELSNVLEIIYHCLHILQNQSFL